MTWCIGAWTIPLLLLITAGYVASCEYPDLVWYTCDVKNTQKNSFCFMTSNSHLLSLLSSLSSSLVIVVIISCHHDLPDYASLEFWDLNHWLSHLLKSAQLKIVFHSCMASMLYFLVKSLPNRSLPLNQSSWYGTFFLLFARLKFKVWKQKQNNNKTKQRKKRLRNFKIFSWKYGESLIKKMNM